MKENRLKFPALVAAAALAASGVAQAQPSSPSKQPPAHAHEGAPAADKIPPAPAGVHVPFLEGKPF
ncbi:MAG TPA: cytochrome c5 family protein, partial [Thermoanaerobaculia bacterium]